MVFGDGGFKEWLSADDKGLGGYGGQCTRRRHDYDDTVMDDGGTKSPAESVQKMMDCKVENKITLATNWVPAMNVKEQAQKFLTVL